MSTKIYDAYRVNVLMINRFRKFGLELSRLYFAYLKNIFYAQMALNMASFCELTPYLLNHDLEQHDLSIKSIAGFLNHGKNGKPSESMDYQDAKAVIESKPNMRSLVQEFTLAMMDGAHDAYGLRKGANDATIALYGPTNESTYSLVMAFGRTFQAFMAELANPKTKNKDYRKFQKKYQIMDWHYQNQTDRPDHVPESEWTQREKDWDELMTTGVPSEESMIIKLYDMDRFKNDIRFESYVRQEESTAELKSRLREGLAKNFKLRLKNYAMDYALDEYIKNAKDAEKPELWDDGDETVRRNWVLATNRRFKNDLENKKSIASKILKKYMDKIRPYMCDFNNINVLDDVLGSKFFDLDKYDQDVK